MGAYQTSQQNTAPKGDVAILHINKQFGMMNDYIRSEALQNFPTVGLF